MNSAASPAGTPCSRLCEGDGISRKNRDKQNAKDFMSYLPKRCIPINIGSEIRILNAEGKETGAVMAS
jgi:hypothetical protein